LTWNEDPFWDPTEKGAQDAAHEFGVDLTFVRSKPDVAVQTQHLKDLIAAGNNGIAISPKDPVQQQQALDDASSKVTLVTFDSDAPNSKRRGFIGTDDYAAGQVAAEQVREAFPQGAKVIITVGSVAMQNGQDRRQGVIDDLLDRTFKRGRPVESMSGPIKGKDYEIVATLTDDGDTGVAVKQLADALKANPQVNCVVGLFSYNGVAAVKAVDQAGRKGQVKIIGFDESAEEQAAVEAGDIYSSVLQDQYRCGYETVRVLSDIYKGVEQGGAVGPRMVALPILVMKPEFIKELRANHIIRDVPAAK